MQELDRRLVWPGGLGLTPDHVIALVMGSLLLLMAYRWLRNKFNNAPYGAA